MRTLTPELAARLDESPAHWTMCWRIQRRDGVVLGLTAHDRSFWIDGVSYEARTSFEPSAISITAGLETADMAFQGAVSSGALRAEDLRDGHYDGAGIAVFLIDWRAPEDGQIALFTGHFGRVQYGPEGFSVDCHTVRDALLRPVVQQFSVECRATLGDASCRVPLARHSHLARVLSASAADAVTVDTTDFADADYGYGTLRWLTGQNAGLRQEIFSLAGSHIVLRDPAPHVPQTGDLCRLTRGCDKRFSTCRDRFANISNFRGEPHVPGTDSIAEYPGL